MILFLIVIFVVTLSLVFGLKLFESSISAPEAKILKSIKGHTNFVFSLAVLPDGSLISSSDDKTIKIWNISENYILGHSPISMGFD